MIKAVVFDMDGVIFDSEKLYRKHWKISGKDIGISEEEMEIVCNKLAGATKEVNENMMKKRFGEDFDYMTFRQITMDRMDEDIREHGIDIKPGVMELFNYLKANNIKMALATSTSRERATRNLKNANLYQYFDKLVFGDSIVHGKPAPDIYLAACKELGVESEEAIGVEDSINGVMSSHNAGLYTVMVIDIIKPTAEIRDVYADKILDSLVEIIELMERPTIKSQ